MVGASECFNAMQLPSRWSNITLKIDICKVFNTIRLDFYLTSDAMLWFDFDIIFMD